MKERMISLGGASFGAALILFAGATDAAAPPGRYAVASGTVLDTKTGLTWQQNLPSTNYIWGSAGLPGTAQNYCATLSLSGSGWRLPTVKELETIVDFSISDPAIDPVAFPGTPTLGFFWSATPLATTNPSGAWGVKFDLGFSRSDYGVATQQYVRCVR
jgi:hypothetical protein